MTPDGEGDVERICHEALALDASVREAFVADACAGDEALRREVWSLVSQAATADEFLREPALVTAAQHLAADTGHSLIGRTLGTYQIQSLLGAGGMGEVYRARDTKLGRDVAIKILPRLFVANPDRLARFGREARMLAALNHPNVGAIYGVEDVDGIPALVLELVDGLTLADRLADGPLPVRDALAIATQIADALAAAHESGIVHRDLKPANVALTGDGRAKVLDFGLAKGGGGVAAGSHLSQSPTITMDGTKEGVILGTAAYMSPEQARGTQIDQRTDIWAFGCVLYEMLSGQRAFGGATLSDTIARILEREPEWRALPASTPRKIRDLLRRCLRKDLHQRLHDIAAARIESDDALTRLKGHRRVLGRLAIAATMALALATLTGGWWYSTRSPSPTPRKPLPQTPHEPVSVIIADFKNGTNDPAFHLLLEPMLRRVLEGASFVSAYDRSAMRFTLGVRAPDTLDETAARGLAVQAGGVGVVLSGTIDRQGGGYVVSMKATQTATGRVVADIKGRAPRPQDVLGVATTLVAGVRKALGDNLSESDQSFRANLSATSLEVVKLYAAAQEANSYRQFKEARQHARQAIELDPKFGVGYVLLSTLSSQLRNKEDAEKYVKEALQHQDTLTEREQYSMRGLSYLVASDWQQCAKEYGELVAHYPADPVGHYQRALCLGKLRNMRGAVTEWQQVIALAPKRVDLHYDLALYANFATDFDTAEKTARAIERPDVNSLLFLAFAQLGQGHLSQAKETYETLKTRNLSLATSGLGDLAVYEGRYSDAVRILEQGAAADLAMKWPSRAAAKFGALAHAYLLRGQKDHAVAAAEKAVLNSETGSIRFLAARVFVEAGAIARARTEAARLSLGTFTTSALTGVGGLTKEPEAYAKIIEGEIALKAGDPRQAIRILTEANMLVDTWLGHFNLGRAYLQVPAFAEADAEFDLCIKRRGEALSLFLDLEPTYSFLPAVYDYRRHRATRAEIGGAEGTNRDPGGR